MTDAFDWTGRVGNVWAAEWRRTDRSFANLSHHLDAAILAAAPPSGDVLDIGCGAGATSLALATARPVLHVTGVDLSEGLIAVARERAGDRPNLDFHVADARELGELRTPIRHAGHVPGFTAPPVPDVPRHDPANARRFDLLVSRHGVMFFADPVAGFAALRSRAAPNARFIFSCFRAMIENPWATDLVAALTGTAPAAPTTYAPGPFALADHHTTAAVLADSGWRDAHATAIDFTYVVGAGADPVADALAFFTRIGPVARVLADAAPEGRPALHDRLRAILADHVTGDTVTFPAAAWIWSASAGEPHS